MSENLEKFFHIKETIKALDKYINGSADGWDDEATIKRRDALDEELEAYLAQLLPLERDTYFASYISEQPETHFCKNCNNNIETYFCDACNEDWVVGHDMSKYCIPRYLDNFCCEASRAYARLNKIK